MQYHPDKTDNELLKLKFAAVKEAYETLSDPVKRKKYDLSFDNFTYKKAVLLTPLEILLQVQRLKNKIIQIDPHRIDLDKLEFELTELLSDKNLETLQATAEQEIVQRVIEDILIIGSPLPVKQFRELADQLTPLADKDSLPKLKQALQAHNKEQLWNKYKVAIAITTGIILCFLIYMVAVI